MRTISFICLLVLYFQSSAQFLWQIHNGNVVKWNYYDGDEFNKGFVNTDKWLTRLPWSGAVVSQDIYYVDSNVTFEPGIVKFAIKRQDNYFPLQDWEMDTVRFKKEKIALKDGNKFPFKWTGGLVYTKREYKYGYFEIKFKAPVGKGIWPAFWLYGAKPNNEIDFFELKGEKESSLHVDIHCPDGCGNYKEGWFGYRRGWGHWIDVDQKLKTSFNVLAGEWTKDYIKWFLNGELIAFSNHSFDIAMCMTAGTGIAKDGGPFKPGPDKNTPFPNYFEVDYIRVYKTDTLPNYKEIKNNLYTKAENRNSNSAVDASISKKKSGLKNNPVKNIKHSKVITISVNQVTPSDVSLRILGVTLKDKVKIELSSNSNSIFSLDAKENSEVLVPIGENKKVLMKAEVNGQKIEDTLIIQ